MKKHHTVSLTLLALVLSVGLFSLYRNIGGGQLAEDFQFVTEPSQTYTPQEISDAADAVVRSFKDFRGATMTTLRYVDGASSSEKDNWAERYDKDQGLYFTCDFVTDDTAEQSHLNANSNYQDWSWRVARSNGGNWTIVSSGQG